MIEFLIKPLLIAWLFVTFEPIKNIVNKRPALNILLCFKCVAFWTTIIFGFIFFKEILIFSAIMNSIIGYVYERINNQFPTKLY